MQNRVSATISVYINLCEKAIFFGLLLFVIFLSSGYTTAILYNSLLISAVAWGIKIALQIRAHIGMRARTEARPYKKLNWQRSPLDLPIVILLFFVLVSSLFSPDPILSLKTFWKLTQGALLFFLVSNNLRRQTETKKIIIAMLISASIASALSLLFYAFDYRLSYDKRLLGTFKHQNDFAAYLMLVLPLSIGVFTSLYGGDRPLAPTIQSKGRRLSILALGALGLGTLLMLACLVFTYTRGAWIAVFVAIGALAILFERKLIFAIVALMLILTLTVPTSAKDRFLSLVRHEGGFMGERPYWWGAAARMIYNKPIFGIGGGRFKEEYKFFKPSESIDTPDHAHNVYLQIASESGMLALLAFLAILILAFRAVIQASRNCENRFDLGVVMGIFAALISWCVYGLVDNTLHRRTALFFWFILGMGVALEPPKQTRAQPACQSEG